MTNQVYTELTGEELKSILKFLHERTIDFATFKIQAIRDDNNVYTYCLHNPKLEINLSIKRI
jgi:hypothetical protein